MHLWREVPCPVQMCQEVHSSAPILEVTECMTPMWTEGEERERRESITACSHGEFWLSEQLFLESAGFTGLLERSKG